MYVHPGHYIPRRETGVYRHHRGLLKPPLKGYDKWLIKGYPKGLIKATSLTLFGPSC